jgi:hypothetical protein
VTVGGKDFIAGGAGNDLLDRDCRPEVDEQHLSDVPLSEGRMRNRNETRCQPSATCWTLGSQKIRADKCG